MIFEEAASIFRAGDASFDLHIAFASLVLLRCTSNGLWLLQHGTTAEILPFPIATFALIAHSMFEATKRGVVSVFETRIFNPSGMQYNLYVTSAANVQ